MRNQKGFTLIELLVSSIIIVMALIAIFAVYTAFIRQSAKQRFISEEEMEERTALYLLQRDIFMAGFGLPSEVLSIESRNQNSSFDEIILRGTYITLEKAGESASTVTEVNSNLVTVKKLKERGNIEAGYWVVFMDPFTKKIINNSSATNFCYRVVSTSDSGTPPDELRTLSFSVTLEDVLTPGTIVYGVTEKAQPRNPFYAEVTYTLQPSDPKDKCPPGCMRFVRNEVSANQNTQTILPCVADVQYAYQLMDSDGNTKWENDLSSYSYDIIMDQLKLVRVNLLIPMARLGQFITIPHPKNFEKIEDRTYTFTSEQRKYRWKIVTLELKPRNLL